MVALILLLASGLWNAALALPLAECPANPATSQSSAALPHPDIVLILTDDMDQKLGALTPLTRTRQLIAKEGATAENYFIHTPICCPSRAELLTGRYFHSLRTTNPTDPGCMHVNVSLNLSQSSFYSDYYFAPALQQAGSVGLLRFSILQNDTCLLQDTPSVYSAST